MSSSQFVTRSGTAVVGGGFVALLESLDDLTIDIPTAPALLSHFLADSHLDGILPLEALDDLADHFAAGTADVPHCVR